MAEKEEGAISVNLSKAILKIQTALLDLPRCTERQLLAAGSLLSRPDYEDVVTERSISRLCGYPLCGNPLPSERPRKGHYRISLREHKVYDLHETYNFCSEGCLINSKAFSGTLAAERCSDLGPARISEVLGLFEDCVAEVSGDLGLSKLKIEEKKQHEGDGDLELSKPLAVEEKGVDVKGSGQSLPSLPDNGDLGLSKLTIHEKTDGKAGEVSLEEWIGPSNSIEGYVPRRNREQVFRTTSKPKAKNKKSDIGATRNEVDFTSAVFIGDPFHVGHSDKEASSSVSASEGVGPGHSSAGSDTINEMNFTSTIIMKDPSDIVDSLASTSVSLPNGAGSKAERSDDWDASNKKADSMEQNLKSSLKQKGAIGRNRGVKWADEEESKASLSREADIGSTGSSYMLNELDDERSLRLASAEACAAALLQASEAVTSGDYEAEDSGIVSDAGILILSPSHDGEEEASDTDEDSLAFERSVDKWPKKTVLLDTDMFDVEDSWHDTPPEGYSLTLSTFATLWMALFGWITCSSLAYIYGRDDNSQDEFLFVNGREYPRKIVLSDGRSFEIKKTLAGCVARALPQVISDLRLPTPISTIERATGQLLDTMSFVDALPPFKTKEWHVIILLLIDALSVFRIPALTSRIVNKKILLHKVLNAAQISDEEYETMKDLLIPLGRLPQFSVQSGA